jgi:drug/metabolite transporter (DMT)-like permease
MAVLFCVALLQLGTLHMPDMSVQRMTSFVPVMCAWLLPMFFNMQCLRHTNVETVVMFRLLAVVPIAVGDAVFFGSRFSLGQMLTLLFMVIGAVVYAYSDIASTTEGYLWCFAYMAATVFNTLFIKHLVGFSPIFPPNLVRRFCVPCAYQSPVSFF